MIHAVAELGMQPMVQEMSLVHCVVVNIKLRNVKLLSCRVVSLYSCHKFLHSCYKDAPTLGVLFWSHCEQTSGTENTWVQHDFKDFKYPMLCLLFVCVENAFKLMVSFTK